MEWELERALDESTGSVHAALYELDSPRLVAALLRARRRGLDVRLVLDAGARAESGSWSSLERAGVGVRLLSGAPPHGAMHAKFALYDGALLSDGSYNWTGTSEAEHFENEEFVSDPAVVAAYEDFWRRLWERSSAPWDPGCPSVRFHGERLPACAFSPFGGGDQDVVRALDLTRDSADVAMFSFHSFPIASALARAAGRGVRVRLLLDRDQARGEPVLRYLLRKGAGRPLEIRFLSGPRGPGEHSRMHHKFAVLDRGFLENGSFNFTANAERRNFESLRFSGDPARAAPFAQEFQRLWERGFASGEPVVVK